MKTGFRNLVPYADEAKKNNIPLIVWAVPATSFLKVCRAARISDECVIVARGPFSIEENWETIKRVAVVVLVAKYSGAPGGGKEKLEAAHGEGCKVIVMKRPDVPQILSFTDIEALLEYILDICLGNQ